LRSVLATINGGDSDNPLTSMKRQSHVSPRRSLTRSWEEENQTSSPAEKAASNHTQQNYGTAEVDADENDSTPTVNEEKEHASESLSQRSALHTAFVKRLGGSRLEKFGEMEPEQLAKDQHLPGHNCRSPMPPHFLPREDFFCDCRAPMQQQPQTLM